MMDPQESNPILGRHWMVHPVIGRVAAGAVPEKAPLRWRERQPPEPGTSSFALLEKPCDSSRPGDSGEFLVPWDEKMKDTERKKWGFKISQNEPQMNFEVVEIFAC
jgi:hypothetical protein